MSPSATAQPGPLGGADNELGGELRARLAAYVATFGLRGMEVRLGGDERAWGVPSVVRCEVDEAVDDLEVQFVDGRRVLVQVKRHLDFDLRAGRPLAKVVDQWVDQCSALATDAVPLVAVAGSASRRVHDLAEALDRRRDPHAGAPTPAQAKALQDLSAVLVRLGAVVDGVLGRVSIAVIDLAAGQGGAVPVGLLDGSVVATGQGQAAFEALASAHRERAARRSGLDLDGWIEALRRAQLDLRVDAGGGRSARRAAELAALTRHRDRLIEEARTVDLLVLGTALPPIPAVPLTRVTSNPTESDQDSTDVDRALRRHGRALLLGQPGAGKSTMLRWLAAREAERGWSMPVLVDLRALLDPIGSGGRPLRLIGGIDPLDTLVELASAAAPLDDRDLLAGAIRTAAAEGSLLVCLDSLDETRQYRHMVVSWLRQLLERIDISCDLVLATRTSAYATAATLGWRELWVAAPRQAAPVVLGVLQGFATRDAHGSDWVHTRLRWATDKVTQIPSLADTPLLLTALAIEAAQSGSLDEVTGPARLLEMITEWVASNWERRSDRIGTELPSGLHTAQISDALRSALAQLAWAVVSYAEPPEVGAIETQLTAGYVAEHGLPPGGARALAVAAVHFWDEAGIVVLDHAGRLAGRARSIVEVAAARYVAGLPPAERAVAITALTADPTTFEVLNLLVSLDPGAVGDVVDAAIAGGSRDLLLAVASGLGSSADVSPAVGRLVDALAAIPATGEADQATIVRTIAALPVPPADRDRILAIIEAALPPAAAAVWRAWLLHRWRDPTADEACRAATLAGPHPKPARPQHLTGLRAILFPDPTAEAFGEVVLATTGRLGVGEDDLAEHIRQLAYHHLPARISDAIYRELDRRGFRSDRPTERRRNWEATTAQDVRFEAAFDWLLEHLAEPDRPRHLRVAERRRLERLSRLIEGLAIDRLQVGEFEAAIDLERSDVVAVVEIFLDQGCFDRDAIAAEAASFHTEFQEDRFAWLYLTYDPPQCQLTCWDGADVTGVIASTVRLFDGNYWLAYVALNVLAQVPHSDRAAAASAAAAKAEAEIPPRQRRLAALAALYTEPARYIARWRHAADPILVGAVMERADVHTDRLSLLIEGLGHQDVLVRDEAVGELTPDDATQPVINDALLHALALPDQGTCRYCGQPFTQRTSNCENCGLALPDPRSKIDNLLS